MQRREFITLLGGATASWPLAARTQQVGVRRIGVLTPLAADDAESLARHSAFLQGLQESGWSVGRNVKIDYRFATGDAEQIRQYAAELVALKPDVILATGSLVTAALLQVTRSMPIVFAQLPDPVGNGLITSLARPGGNATGFTNYEYSMSGKWLELLREIAAPVTRALILRELNANGVAQFASIQAVASSLGVEVRPADLRDVDETKRAIAEFAQASDGNRGLIVAGSGWAIVHREPILAIAARHKLPAIYPFRFFVLDGGLIAYGPDSIDPYRRAAGYVDRILKGEKPADLPVQTPTKYELAINLKTAKALGLTVPDRLLVVADEVIE
jgi:putative ABC transport system substrate-binding protein